jgi:glycolate oxidase FAD binding subunit
VAPADSSSTAGSVPAELSKACDDVTCASAADAVAGRQARYIAAPASTAEAAAVLRAAAGLGLTVVPRGSGGRLDWGARPTGCDLIVDTRRMDQVVEHAAGDLVVTAQAGTRLDELAKVLAAAGQRLALDSPAIAGRTSGTVGGLIATGAAGPLRYRYGSPRDLLIGITVVRADGTVARSGGKVVKNVAGYDIGKLFAGSLGTLGLITEATFRLHPQPDAAAWVTLDCPDSASAASAVRAVADSPLAPSAIELDWASAGAPLTVAALLEGEADSVSRRSTRLQELLEAATAGQSSAQTKRADDRPGPRTPPATDDESTSPDLPGGGAVADVGAADEAFRVLRPLSDGRERPLSDGRERHQLADGSGSTGTLVRVAFWAGQLTAVLTAIRAAADAVALDPAISGSAGAGVLEVAVPPSAAAVAVTDFMAVLRAGLDGLSDGLPPSRATAVVLCAPPAVRDAVDMWGPVPSLALMRAVKDQFDPGHRMAPGRFAGGI